MKTQIVFLIFLDLNPKMFKSVGMEKKYKILVLSDLKESSNRVLKNAVSFSKLVGGETNLFHVKKPTDIIDRESQLSAYRTINEQRALTKKNIESIINNVNESINAKVNFSYVFGNVKNEIEDYISTYKPDLIVLGKRKSKTFSLGDNITDFVLKAYEGIVMIIDNKSDIQFHRELSLGLLDEKNKLFNINITDLLLAQSKKPLKSFKFVSKAATENIEQSSNDSSLVEYIFERNDNSIQNLAKFLKKSDIDILLVDGNYNEDKKSGGLNQSDIRNVINQVNIPLIISNNRNVSGVS